MEGVDDDVDDDDDTDADENDEDDVVDDEDAFGSMEETAARFFFALISNARRFFSSISRLISSVEGELPLLAASLLSLLASLPLLPFSTDEPFDPTLDGDRFRSP